MLESRSSLKSVRPFPCLAGQEGEAVEPRDRRRVPKVARDLDVVRQPLLDQLHLISFASTEERVLLLV